MAASPIKLKFTRTNEAPGRANQLMKNKYLKPPVISTNIVIHRDFLAMHRLECRANDAPFFEKE